MGAGGSKQHRQIRNLGDRPSPPGKPILIPGTPRSDPDVITIKWDPPQFIGGSKLIGYLVEHRRMESRHWVRATPLLVRGTTLTLSGLEPGMRYQFRVTAENQAGKSEPGLLSEAFAVSHQRHVSLAPSFLKPLIDSTAIENEKVEFAVVAEGTPTPNIRWFKDGVEVFSTRRQRIIVEGEKSSFIIHQAALQDEGEIKCTATNIAGHIVSRAKLTLEAGAGLRLPRQYEEGLLFELGEAVRLRVGVTGKPEPSVTWYHNGREMHSDGRVEFIKKDKYVCMRIAEATRQDRGEYRVTATNKLGSDSASILVTITDRPLPPGKAQVVMTLGRCVTLAWTPPNDDGGCKIGNYIVEYYRIGWNMWLKAATCRQLTTTLGDLIEGSEYKFRVKAENPYGMSDPSQESDVIFIPDPKRGLLEAPPKGERNDLLKDSEEWLEATRKHKELEAAKSSTNQDWEDVPSQVSLANQVLRKVKMAPKRGWSEDSQGSPPATPERQLCPVPPKRKLRDKRKAQAIAEVGSKPLESGYKETKSDLKPNSSDLRRFSNPDNLYSSSEMMFVLLPGEDEPDDNRNADENRELEKESLGTLPPMSFSSPELGSCEPYEIGNIRNSVSSSELLHERTLDRMNKDIADEEAEQVLKTKYGIERKRSFERRQKREPYVFSLSYIDRNENKINSEQNDYEIKSITDVIMEEDEEEKEEEEELITRGIIRRSSKERFMQSDSSFEEFSTRIEQDDESDYDDEYDYDEGDDEYEENSDLEIKYDFENSRISRFTRNDHFEEDTFHRNMTMLKIPSIQPLETLKESSPQGSDRMIPIITLNEQLIDSSPPVQRKNSVDMYLEELRKSAEREIKPKLEGRQGDSRKSPIKFVNITPERSPPIPQEKVVKKSPERDLQIIIPQNQSVPNSPSPTSTLPKPILKITKDELNNKKTDKKNKNIINRISLMKSKPNDNFIPATRSVESEKKNKKKVRIEEPFDNDYFDDDDDNLVMTGEVAKNRRRMNRHKKETNEPANVVISHYSDIVREFGKTNQKPKPTLYLNYEELKAAAERTNPIDNIDLNHPSSIESSTASSNISQEQLEKKQTQQTIENNTHSENQTAIDITAPTKFQNVTEFILDLFLFCIASYLYLFKDPKLAIPILVLMIYRKIHETVSTKVHPKIKNIFKKSEKTD